MNNPLTKIVASTTLQASNAGGIPINPESLPNAGIGLSIFLIGMLGLLLAAIVILQNYAAGVTWSLSIMILVISGLFGIGLEMFWVSMLGTISLLIMGMILQWT